MSRQAVLERTLGKKAAKKFISREPKKPAFSTVSLEVDGHLIEQIVFQELLSLRASLAHDLKERKADRKIAIFHQDKELDIASLKGHLFAIETVLKYYCTPDQLKKHGLK